MELVAKIRIIWIRKCKAKNQIEDNQKIYAAKVTFLCVQVHARRGVGWGAQRRARKVGGGGGGIREGRPMTSVELRLSAPEV
jgi:hypothetical protein